SGLMGLPRSPWRSWPSIDRVTPDPDRPMMYRTNSLVTVSVTPELVCELPLENARYILPSVALVANLVECLTPGPGESIAQDLAARLGLEPGQAMEVVDELIARQIVVPAEEIDLRRQAARDWVRMGWFDALLFHLATRETEFADSSSG